MVSKEQKTVSIELLKDYEKNPNRHTQDQIEALKKSIDTYGQYYPIIVDENYMILCGHGKKMALEASGRTQCEVVVLKGLTEKQKKKLILTDNKIQTMSSIDFTLTESIIKEIGDTDIIGFNPLYLETIISENVVDNSGVDLFAPVATPKTAEKQMTSIPEQRQNEQEKEYEDVQAGLQTAHTIICPHCGKEITL